MPLSVGPCYHSMAPSQVADWENDLRIWRVAANILTKQSRTVDRDGPPVPDWARC